MDSKEIIKQLKKDGWQIVRIKGSHNHFNHPTIIRNSHGATS